MCLHSPQNKCKPPTILAPNWVASSMRSFYLFFFLRCRFLFSSLFSSSLLLSSACLARFDGRRAAAAADSSSSGGGSTAGALFGAAAATAASAAPLSASFCFGSQQEQFVLSVVLGKVVLSPTTRLRTVPPPGGFVRSAMRLSRTISSTSVVSSYVPLNHAASKLRLEAQELVAVFAESIPH